MESTIDQYPAPHSVVGKSATWKNFFCDGAGQNFSEVTFLKGKSLTTTKNPK